MTQDAARTSLTGTAHNLLTRAASAYLRTARHQPVAWREWGAEAFAEAERKNKPVLLDVGAVWCHWCHVMDRESYEDPETAAVINEHFIAIKVDRDERPDIDTRYQAAVSAISGQGGWPLTAFLTPSGMPFFGGTYFPPEERYGRPSFRRVLLTMAEAFRNRRAEVEESAGSILEAIEQNEAFSARGDDVTGASGRVLMKKLIGSALAQFDAVHGGFGSQPKFPHAGVLDLLIDAAGRGDAQAEQVARVTLERMAAGGVYDQLGGGFHRYSVDERWHVPHFEKMAYDNGELLKAYAHAWRSFREPRFLEAARDIVRWMDEVLSDRERGGFYASQDADVSTEDDGDFFTWTEIEVREAIEGMGGSPEEFEAARLYFGLRPVGDMHHHPAKNVLRRMMDLPQMADTMQVSEDEAQWRLAAASAKLRARRAARPAPAIDRTLYTGWNALCISAYLVYAAVVGPDSGVGDPLTFALRSLDRVLHEAVDEAGNLLHVIAYADGVAPSQPVAAGLDDYVFLAQAALDAWELSGTWRYFKAARRMADELIVRFYDEVGGGFFDTARAEDGAATLGALAVRRKPVQDAPTPSGNAVAAALLLRLAELTGEPAYQARARATLQAFAGVVEHFGHYAATYGLALRRLLEPSARICVLGEDALAEQLATAACESFAINHTVIQLRREQLHELPPTLAQTLPRLAEGRGSFALVCRGNTCLTPAASVEELRAQLAVKLAPAT